MNGEMIKSPVIEISDGIQCRIELYPKNIKKESKDYMSIYLETVEGYLMARERFYILNNKNEQVNSMLASDHMIKENSAGWGFYQFMKLERLNEENMMKDSTTGLIGITLTVGCEIISSWIVQKEPILELEYSASLEEFDNFEKLVDNKQFSDVVLTVKSKKLQAHKIILSNNSEFFAELFINDVNKNARTVIEIKDVSYDVMKEVLRYMYAGKVNDLDKMAKGLHVAADKYLIESLKEICQNHLAHQLSAENVLEYLNFASVRNAPDLKKQCLDFVKTNMKNVVENLLLS
ncbi:hypothetical protein QAD02_011426 [Eretmocerus hayati]|uniref:Uncharacterized protein n=1 Tax=Eretmocerus hayati TaxID=131215 RepID=A0ACC2NWF2_9HYME|nr:hypothetical protein QAD02_011426 [Eretmocerus hayati]